MSKKQKNWLETARRQDFGAVLAELWQQKAIVRLPGVYDSMTGMLARDAGFGALYLSGGALTASRGLPDVGILTMNELVDATRSIVRAVGLPLIVDGDTGYGETLNTMRLVRELEDAGAAAVHLEDQVLPKKCGHLNGKQLVAPEHMAEKIAAARRAGTDIRIIARTDAAAIEGLDAAIRRANLYVEAGADAVFPEALGDHDAFRRFATQIQVPLLANMTEFGKTPQTTASEFEAMGYAMIIWPVSALRIAARAVENLFREIAQSGSAQSQIEKMQTRAELYDTLRYYSYEELDRSIQRTVLETQHND